VSDRPVSGMLIVKNSRAMPVFERGTASWSKRRRERPGPLDRPAVVDDLGVPVVELFDEPSPRPGRRGRIGLGFAVVSWAAAIAVGASVVTDDGGHATPAHRRDPRAEVVAAVDATAATGSFDMQFRTSETTMVTHDAPALMSPIAGFGSMTFDPHVMVATA